MTISQYDEWAAVAERFGVDMEQVRRDHLISHLLGAIAAGVPADDVVFFGGTALSRTYLTDARLSEDIDLIAVVSRTDVAAQIEAAVRRGLARSHGRPTWRPALSATSGSQPATVASKGPRASRFSSSLARATSGRRKCGTSTSATATPHPHGSGP